MVNNDMLSICGTEDWEVGTVLGSCGRGGEIPCPALSFLSQRRAQSTLVITALKT